MSARLDFSTSKIVRTGGADGGLFLNRARLNLAANWLFHVVYQLAQIGAHQHERIANAIEEFGVFTLEIASAGMLEPVETDQRRAGVLLGLAPPKLPIRFELPGGTARLLFAKILTPAELGHVLENGESGVES